jgi:hypothetical protein
MENELDLEEFESLSGVAFSCYAVKMKDLHVGSSFIEYFLTRKDHWDAVHLELALWWLGKNGSLAAHREIVGFVEHPNLSIRVLALGLTCEMKNEVDAQIMARVVKALERKPDRATAIALNSILAKPSSKDAQILARRYLEEKARQ